MQRAITFPFFLQQVNFKQKPLREKAKYMLFFVTEVVQLRADGMEPSIIVERLADRGVGFLPLTLGETVDDIKQYFEECVKEGELRHHRRGDNPYAAYGFVRHAAERYWSELNKGLRVVMLYARPLQGRAGRISEILMATGVMPWSGTERAGVMEECIRSAVDQYVEHEDAVDDSCAVAFLITAEFKYEGLIRHVIDCALCRYRSMSRDRFAIIPIVLLKRGEKPCPELIEERVPKPLRDEQVACQWARDDADVIGHIIGVMPARLGVIGWRSA